MSVLLNKKTSLLQRFLATLLCAVVGVTLLPKQAFAECWSIDDPVKSRNIVYRNSYYVEIATNGRANEVGVRKTGIGTGTASGVVPPSYNLNSTLFTPYGSLLFSGVGSQIEMAPGGNTPYVAEQVLFRCSPGSESLGLYEFFATNSTSVIPACRQFSGIYADGDGLGVPGAFRTRLPELGLKLTHVNSGKVLRDRWGAHRLTGMDTDSMGYVLVKVKNFSPLRADMYRINNRSKLPNDTWASIKEPCKISANAIYLFNWPSSPLMQTEGELPAGYSSANVYVGRFNMGNGSDVTNIGSCGNTFVEMPNVKFTSITVVELNNNGTRTQPINISFKCQFQGNSTIGTTPFVSGTGTGQTAMGFAIDAANQQSALNQGLGVSGSATGVSYLLSNAFCNGSPVATNVGTQITWASNNAPLNFALYNPANIKGGNPDGWYGVTTNATLSGTDSNGYQNWTQNFMATFKRLPQTIVSNGGDYCARAQFIIRVQ